MEFERKQRERAGELSQMIERMGDAAGLNIEQATVDGKPVSLDEAMYNYIKRGTDHWDIRREEDIDELIKSCVQPWQWEAMLLINYHLRSKHAWKIAKAMFGVSVERHYVGKELQRVVVKRFGKVIGEVPG